MLCIESNFLMSKMRLFSFYFLHLRCAWLLSHIWLCDSMDCSPRGSSVHVNSSDKNTRVGPPPGDLPNPGIEHRSPALQADSLLSEPPGKLRKTWVGSPFPSPGDLQPKDQTQVSCISGRFLTIWASPSLVLYLFVCLFAVLGLCCYKQTL